MRSFVAVASRRSFTRAAEEQHIAQQALSQQIRTLEKLVGVKLLDRNSRRVELTPAGTVFLQEAKRVLAAADRAVGRAVLASRGETGNLRLIYTLTTAYDTVPALVEECRAELPGVKIAAREVWAEDLPGLLLDGRADVGLAPASPLPDGLHRRPVREEALVALMSPAHPLSRRRAIRLLALKDDTFHVWPRPMAPGFYDAVVAACRAARFEPRIDEDAAGNTVWNAISSGRGVGLTVASLGAQRPEGIHIVNLAQPAPTLMIDVVTAIDDSPVVRRFLAIADKTATGQGWLSS